MVKKDTQIAYYKSPIGWIKIGSDGREIVAVDFASKNRVSAGKGPVLQKALRQIDEYFKGKRKRFDLKLRFKGTPFQEKVWSELQKINLGSTASYQNIATRTGKSKAVRAAGTAIGRNPLAIIVPCHRVIASNGLLAGYAGGVWRKKWLLDHEKRMAAPARHTGPSR